MSAGEPVELGWEVGSVINLAAQQNAVRVLGDVRIRNAGSGALEGARLRVTSSPGFFRPLEVDVDEVPAGGSCTVGTHALRMDPGILRDLTERIRGEVVVELVGSDGTPAFEERREVEVLAPNEWAGVRGLPELLAAFVLPNTPQLAGVLRTASERLAAHTGSGGLDGYQSRSPERVQAIARSLYEAVASLELHYINPPASFETTGQKIRLPAEILTARLGTCLDLTVLLAALLEQAGLHPILVLVEGHAYPGVWLVDRPLQTPATDDAAHLRNRVRAGELVVFDSSAVANGVPWDDAVTSATASLAQDTLQFAVDVRAARLHRILPLQLVSPTASPEERAVEPEQPLEPASYAPNAAEPPLSSTPQGRLERWKARLLDLSLRNKLVAFRDNKRSIPLAHVDGAGLEDALAAGRTLIVSARAAFLDANDPRDPTSHALLSGEQPLEAFHLEQQQSGRVFSTLPEREFDKRASELFLVNRLALGESGAVTLYLTVGMLHWYEREDSAMLRKAPLLLVPVSLSRRGNGLYAIESADDETRVNVTLLKKLKDDYDAHLPDIDILPTDASGVDVAAILRAFAGLAAGFPRWEVTGECTVSQLEFTKFLMWLDLEAKTERILKNPVVAHIFEGGGESFPMATGFPDPQGLDGS
ncbi:MAG: DUF4011 domain-containing protein, partial [Myxococcales bacterium]|nr:DUF4011 domain-containing protein [Myxococcales bacterium]